MDNFTKLIFKFLGKKAISVRDVPAQAFIQAFAAQLKKAGKLEIPRWADLVKTAHWKELSPENPDWFYVRAAAVARHLYLRPGSGVGDLRYKFGGKGSRGSMPEHKMLAGESILRRVVQQLEKLGLAIKDGRNGGRRITSKGQRELDRIACLVAGQSA